MSNRLPAWIGAETTSSRPPAALGSAGGATISN